MPVLVITTRQGMRYEAEVRDFHDANHEINHFEREYLLNHPSDRITDASIIDHGNIISRFRNGAIEDF